MVNLTSLVIVLLLSTQILATCVIELVGPLTASAFTWLKPNYTEAIVRANVLSDTSSTLDPYVVNTLKNVRIGGLSPDIYISLCRGIDPSDQITNILSSIPVYFNNLWIKIQDTTVPGCQWSGYTQEENCAFASSAINTALGIKKQKTGVFTSRYIWTTLFGSNCGSIGKLWPNPKLWVAIYDSKGKLDTTRTVNSFMPFGGWTSFSLKKVSNAYRVPLFGTGILTAFINQNWKQ